MNTDLEIQWQQIETNMKNVAIYILEYEERKKFNKEWFNEECRQLLEQKNKAYQAYLARPVRVKRAECEERRKWAHTIWKKKKRDRMSINSCYRRGI